MCIYIYIYIYIYISIYDPGRNQKGKKDMPSG